MSGWKRTRSAKSATSRRDFLRLAALSLGSLALRPWDSLLGLQSLPSLDDFPIAERLGRVLDGKVLLKAKPDIDSNTVGELNADEVVVWLNERVGSRPLWFSQRFVETPDGFVYAPNLQPVRNQVNAPMNALANPDGMWAEVTVPYVDVSLQNPPARSPWVRNTPNPRLYYSQIMWVDNIRKEEDGRVFYRVKEKYGTFGDVFWAPAEAFRPITAQEMTPINPEVDGKQVVVNLRKQALSCFEGNTEVYYCRVSTGGQYDEVGSPSEKWATPVGSHTIWRKLVSVHMTGGTTGGGYDLAGIGWTTLFSSKGMAVHSTFWHNSYGIPKSHGCVNARPEDAKWVFRWTLPVVEYNPGDLTVAGQTSTKVNVMEG